MRVKKSAVGQEDKELNEYRAMNIQNVIETMVLWGQKLLRSAYGLHESYRRGPKAIVENLGTALEQAPSSSWKPLVRTHALERSSRWLALRESICRCYVLLCGRGCPKLQGD